MGGPTPRDRQIGAGGRQFALVSVFAAAVSNGVVGQQFVHASTMRRNMYSSADVARQSLRRGDSGFIDELMAESSTKFIPVDSERNLIRRGEQVEPVFLNGMMARVLVQGGALPIFLGTMDEVSYFALDVTGFDLGERNMGEFLDLRQVGALLFAREG